MKSIAAVLLLIPCLALAQGTPLPTSLLVQALRSGEVEIALPDAPQLRAVLSDVRRRTGDAGPVMLRIVRIAQFKQQPTCGRVGFFMYQPTSSNRAQVSGAQLNICESGLPPRRVCKDAPAELVPAQQRCRNGGQPIDTAEVAESIRQAVLAGGVSAASARRQTRSVAAAAKERIEK